MWGQGGATTVVDADLLAAKDGPLEEQRRLFFMCARHLFDNQVRVPEDERDDPSDNDQWLANLATWFGWIDELRDEVIREAMAAALEILDYEIADEIARRDSDPDVR